jgi:chloride channel protein, CIC family
MTSRSEPPIEIAERPGNPLVLALLAPVAGAIAGLLGSVFRLALERGDHLRNALIFWAHGRKTLGFF